MNKRLATMARGGDRGSILVVSLIAAVLIAGFTYAFLVVTRSEIESAKSGARRAKALQAAEAGIDEALDRLNRGTSAPVDRSSESLIGYQVHARDDGSTASGNRLYTLMSHSRFAGEDRAVEVVVENQTLGVRLKSAITSNAPIALAGNTVIDGRDYDAEGFGTIGPGNFGISSSQDVAVAGNAAIGGNGQAPILLPTPLDNVFMQNVPYGDGNEFPRSPDALLGLPDGTLKRVAQTQGTYFDRPTDFDGYFAQSGNRIPGGKVIVLDYPASPTSGPEWNPVNFGSEYNEEPSIIVFHSEYSNAVMRNLNGRFKGFIVTDLIAHKSGEARILGALLTYGQQQIGSAYGTGDARIFYSSSVLANLPVVPFFLPRAWREVAAGPGTSSSP